MAASFAAPPLKRVCQAGLMRAIIPWAPFAAASEAGSTCSTTSLPLLGILPVFYGMPNHVESMELGVPKSKITPSRKGKRNGPKFLKPVSVIARCTVCGRVKLPQFFCCNGTPRDSSSEKE